MTKCVMHGIRCSSVQKYILCTLNEVLKKARERLTEQPITLLLNDHRKLSILSLIQSGDTVNIHSSLGQTASTEP